MEAYASLGVQTPAIKALLDNFYTPSGQQGNDFLLTRGRSISSSGHLPDSILHSSSPCTRQIRTTSPVFLSLLPHRRVDLQDSFLAVLPNSDPVMKSSPHTASLSYIIICLAFLFLHPIERDGRSCILPQFCSSGKAISAFVSFGVRIKVADQDESKFSTHSHVLNTSVKM